MRRSILHLSVQLELRTIGIFEDDVHLAGIEGKCPGLDLAVSEDSTLEKKSMLVQPTPPLMP
jgi:hypothetical protein